MRRLRTLIDEADADTECVCADCGCSACLSWFDLEDAA